MSFPKTITSHCSPHINNSVVPLIVYTELRLKKPLVVYMSRCLNSVRQRRNKLWVSEQQECIYSATVSSRFCPAVDSNKTLEGGVTVVQGSLHWHEPRLGECPQLDRLRRQGWMQQRYRLLLFVPAGLSMWWMLDSVWTAAVLMDHTWPSRWTLVMKQIAESFIICSWCHTQTPPK